MSNRLPVPPSRTSVSRRRVAKLYSTTPNNPNGNTNSKSSVSRPIPLKIKKEAPDDEIKVRTYFFLLISLKKKHFYTLRKKFV